MTLRPVLPRRRLLALSCVLAGLAVLALAPATARADDAPRLTEELLAGLELRPLGPALMSGRVSDIVIHPDDPGTWYVAVGSGGVWKTTNAGTTWQSIFDGQGSYSIGCLTLDPQDPDVVWVGTGENISGRHVGYGDGVYRSRDGGQTWQNVGLPDSEHIGTIVVHPEDSQTVWVAAQGPLWSAGGERGVYLTRDGGEVWEQVLAAGPYTGANEVVIDPSDPDVLYASLHQRFRDVAALINGGPESGIFKSTDGGRTWRELTTGLPAEDLGKIGLAVSPQDPQVVYAAIELGRRTGGFWRSADGGESWQKRSDKVARGTGPHYYQEIFASPHAFDRVYFMDVRMAVTHDGGATFVPVGEEHKHVDNHALAFVAHDPDYLLAGCDGGLYQSWNLGRDWQFVGNLPVTQFYKVAVDYDRPFYHVIGGTQDNSTQHGPVRTDNVHGIRNSDWWVPIGGDGHQPAIDPTDPDIVYASSQQCYFQRVDRQTGESTVIRPMPGAEESTDRWNWDGPILISHHDPARLYVASQRLWRSDDRGDSWRALSGDLTRGEDRLRREMMDRVWSIDAHWDLLAMSQYGTITGIAESPLDADLLYVGTDDGLLQVSEDGGQTWRRGGDLPDVPEHVYINHVLADRFDRETVYAVADAHKLGDLAPYVFRSTDRGRSWRAITGDLPDRHVVWRLAQDHVQPDLLFAGTEFGVFVTLDGGERWLELTGNAPTIAFRDLAIQTRENDLVGATFGRGFWVLDDYTPLRELSEELLAGPAHLFTPREAPWYLERRGIGGSEKASQGAAFFTAPNPPFGAVFTYYLRDSVQSREEARQERERELAEAGEDTPTPGWEALRQEELEDAPAVLLTVRDRDGAVVRHVPGPTAAGLHRVSWDLRYPSTSPERDGQRNEESGHLALPGAYTVELVRRQDGRHERLAGPVSFSVVPLQPEGPAGADRVAAARFRDQVATLQRQVRGAAVLVQTGGERLDAIKVALMRTPAEVDALYATAVDLEQRLEQLHERLQGNRRRSRLNEPQPLGLRSRLSRIDHGTARAHFGPGAMYREQLGIVRDQFAVLRTELARVVEQELPALEAELDAAGVPWTPGRGVPGE